VILMAEGWTALNLGANLPVETLIDAIEKHRPELVALSCTVTYDPVAFRSDCERVVHAAAEAGAHIALGGAALDETVGSCVTNKSVTIVRSMEDFVEFIHSTFRRDQGKCACMNGECASS